MSLCILRILNKERTDVAEQFRTVGRDRRDAWPYWAWACCGRIERRQSAGCGNFLESGGENYPAVILLYPILRTGGGCLVGRAAHGSWSPLWHYFSSDKFYFFWTSLFSEPSGIAKLPARKHIFQKIH